MRSFKALNVSYKPEDGKKRFPGVVVSIRELVNLPIVVKDFETGIKTEQGEMCIRDRLWTVSTVARGFISPLRKRVSRPVRKCPIRCV